MVFLPRKRRHRFRSRNEKRADGGIGDVGLRENYGCAWAFWEAIWLVRCVRGSEAIHVTAAVCGVFEDDEFGVQIVGEGDDEEEQDQGTGDGGPFAPGTVTANSWLMRPARPPESHAAEGEKKPENVENEFHRLLDVWWARLGWFWPGPNPVANRRSNLLSLGRLGNCWGGNSTVKRFYTEERRRKI